MGKRTGPTGVVLDCIAIGLAAFAAVWRPPSLWVERWYANVLYPALERTFVPGTSAMPFALGDLLAVALVAIPVWWFVRLRAAGGRRGLLVLTLARRTLALAAVVLLWFELAWGLNYDRVRVARKIDYQPVRVDARGFEGLQARIVAGLNENVVAAHASGADDAAVRAALVGPFREVVERPGSHGGFTPARPKTSLFNKYLAMTATTGYTDPFTYEVVLERHLGPYERPFTLAHEWGHLAGFASETEANFIAALTCTRSTDPLIRYSGWMGIYFYLPRSEAATLPLAPQVQADIAAIRAGYAQRIERRLFTIAWGTYNSYLKANRVSSGTASYGAFVDLLVGTSFDRAGLPELRADLPSH